MGRNLMIFVILCAFAVGQSQAQIVNGDEGTDFGDIKVGGGDLVIDLPENGIINVNTLTVRGGSYNPAILSFKRNSLNTSVMILATGDIVVNSHAYIDVYGENGSAVRGGQGGPGGFNGGEPGNSENAPGAGHGPGGGLGGPSNDGTKDADDCGHGGYGLAGGSFPRDGAAYGSRLLIPLVGGSGGGGASGIGGGGGGGALLLASNTRIVMNGHIRAFGGVAGTDFTLHCYGSGGAIRLVAPIVSGSGQLDVRGFESTAGDAASPGRIRIDTVDRSGVVFQILPTTAPTAVSSFMRLFPDPLPQLNITEVAGHAIGPGTTEPVSVILPTGSPPTQSVTIQANDFMSTVPIQVALIPETGDPIKVDTQIDNITSNPGSVTITADLAQNVVYHVYVWTR
jgi:hypothetical protein